MNRLVLVVGSVCTCVATLVTTSLRFRAARIRFFACCLTLAIALPGSTIAAEFSQASGLRLSALKLEQIAGPTRAISLASAIATRRAVQDYLNWLESQEFHDPDDLARIDQWLGICAQALVLVGTEPDAPQSAAIVEALRSDFVARYKFTDEQLGSEAPSPFVRMSLRAKVEGTQAELASVNVGYVMEGLATRGSRFRVTIPQLAPVTGYKILPGRYLFFVERSGSIVGSKNASVGLSGAQVQEEVVEILVPAQPTL